MCFVRHSRGGGAFNSRRLVIQFFLCFCSSFPHALSGNPVPLLLICLMAHPFVFPLASVRAGYFLLLVQEKVTKENTPREPRPSRFALRVRKGRPDSPDRVARRDAREFANGQEAHRANPGLTLRTAAGSAAPGVCSLWLLSLAQARESDPLARMRAENRTDAVRKNQKPQQKLDSSLRWNDELRGKTLDSGFRRNDELRAELDSRLRGNDGIRRDKSESHAPLCDTRAARQPRLD